MWVGMYRPPSGARPVSTVFHVPTAMLHELNIKLYNAELTSSKDSSTSPPLVEKYFMTQPCAGRVKQQCQQNGFKSFAKLAS